MRGLTKSDDLGNLLGHRLVPRMSPIHMSYQALLFYRDEKTARVLMQVLDELDFSVSPESEPFAAVKTLLAQRFDLLLVDCEDEQNAALLFKSARNSDFNNNAVAVAVTTGQAGIAHAFRAGAGLVLTKPISVEQAKSTLRLARGALRKAEAQKPAEPQKPTIPLSLPLSLATHAAAAGADFEAVAPPIAPPVFKSVVIPVPVEPEEDAPELTASASDTAHLEEPTAIVDPEIVDDETFEPPDEHMARSGADLTKLQAKSWSPVEEESPLRLSPKPSGAIAPAPAPASDELLRPPDSVGPEIRPDAAPAQSGKEAAKAAPAKAAAGAPANPSTLRFASLGIKEEEDDLDPAKSRKNFFIAAVLVLALAGGGYYAWLRLHPSISLPFLNSGKTPATAGHTTTQSQTQPAAKPPGDATAAGNTAPVPDAATPGASAASPLAELAANAPGSATPKADAAKPGASPSSSQAAGPAVLPEDVSQALVISKVQPVYPESAKRTHLEGSVRLQVSVSPNGDVTGAKLLSGNPVLASAAIAAVRQWKYQVYFVNGQAMAIETQATLDFKLPSGQPTSQTN
jgi:TonB family protein